MGGVLPCVRNGREPGVGNGRVRAAQQLVLCHHKAWSSDHTQLEEPLSAVVQRSKLISLLYVLWQWVVQGVQHIGVPPRAACCHVSWQRSVEPVHVLACRGMTRGRSTHKQP